MTEAELSELAELIRLHRFFFKADGIKFLMDWLERTYPNFDRKTFVANVQRRRVT